MSNRAIRRAAERLALKAAKREQRAQAQTEPLTMTAAAVAGASFSPNVDFASEEENNNDQAKRPLSDAQLAANRANAQKSHGPVTPEGRAKSCLNAVKTGLTGQTVLLTSDDAAAYQAHLDRHFKRHAPATDEEHTLVQMIADAEWRFLRIPGLEASIYAVGRVKFADLHPEEKDPTAREALIKGEILIAYRRDLSNLALQERRLRNQHKADLAELKALQQERKGNKKEKAKLQERMYQAIRLMLGCQAGNKSFDPSLCGFEFSIPEIEHCHQALSAAKERKEPLPCVADLLDALRNTRKEAQAA